MGEKPEFEVFVAARSAALLRTAFFLTHDAAQAEDLLQTALAKAWFAWGRLHDDPEPYVHRIIVTSHTSWWRRRWTHELPRATLPEGTPAPGVAEPDLDLWTALGHLPPRQRAVVVLRYVEDLTEPQTAELLGCSVGTVKSQSAKALAKLRVDPALAPASTDGGSR